MTMPISDFAETFPSLVGKPGVRPWQATELAHWCISSPAVTSGSLAAAKFVLAVWNPGAKHKRMKNFMLGDVGVWDAAHVRAFAAWAAQPWWY